MRERELLGVKHLAAGRHGPIRFPRAAVLRVAHNRMADVREVNADLVRATRFDADTQERRLGKFLNHFVMGDRGATGCRAHTHFFPIMWISSH